MAVLDLFSLKGKNALVTASSQGLGAGMAIALAQAGANVDTAWSSRCIEIDD